MMKGITKKKGTASPQNLVAVVQITKFKGSTKEENSPKQKPSLKYYPLQVLLLA